jgi:hypothetical protein
MRILDDNNSREFECPTWKDVDTADSRSNTSLAESSPLLASKTSGGRSDVMRCVYDVAQIGRISESPSGLANPREVHKSGPDLSLKILTFLLARFPMMSRSSFSMQGVLRTLPLKIYIGLLGLNSGRSGGWKRHDDLRPI